MKVEKTYIDGVVVITPDVFEDARGYFFESFSEKRFHEQVDPTVHFLQDNESCSTKGVVRGLHFQRPPYAQAKLVRVIEGSVLDVAVDLRHGSDTYGKYVAVRLTAENHRQLFIPRGFAHGFSVLSDKVVFEYKCDNYYAPDAEGGLAWNDKTLNIDWRLNENDIILSEKDKHRPSLEELGAIFNIKGEEIAAK
jgi:dTDP-4-dehydrorhamnose 3,5-epimerase